MSQGQQKGIFFTRERSTKLERTSCGEVGGPRGLSGQLIRESFSLRSANPQGGVFKEEKFCIPVAQVRTKVHGPGRRREA